MMPNILEKELKEGKLNSIYLLYGVEKYVLETNLKKIKKNFGNLVIGINYITIDESNVNNIISDIETPAFGYDKKLIIARNTGLLKKEGKKKNIQMSKLIEKVSNYIKDNIDIIKETCVIVFIEEEAEKNKLYKVIDQYGVVCNFEELKVSDLCNRLKAIIKAYKVNIYDVDLKYLVESCGTNMENLINESRKLIEYVGENGTITKKEIDLLCIKQIESIIFDLTDNLGQKNIKKAMEVLYNLIYAKEPIQKIFVTLYNHFKKLYIVKLSEKYNRNLAQSMNLKPNQMFLTTKYKKQASYFKEQDIKDVLNEFIDLDFKYKTGLIDINIGLESILCRYCS